MKILVVEDDPLQRGVIAAMLKGSGNEVMEAASGEDAVATVAKAEALDLVLMDLRMPGMQGKEALDRIRALSGWRGQVPVKAMSARALSPVEDAIFDGYVAKGPNLHALLADAVHEAMSRASPSSPPTSDPGQAFRGETPGPPFKDRRAPTTPLGWTRINLPVVIFVGSVLLGSGRLLVTTTSEMTEVRFRLANIEQEMRRAELHAQDPLDALGKAVADVAQRLDAQDKRITVLEAQLRFFNERSDVSSRNVGDALGRNAAPPQPLARRP